MWYITKKVLVKMCCRINCSYASFLEKGVISVTEIYSYMKFNWAWLIWCADGGPPSKYLTSVLQKCTWSKMMLHPCHCVRQHKKTFLPAIKHCKHIPNGDNKNVLTIYTVDGVLRQSLGAVLKLGQIYASWSKIKQHVM